MPTMFEPMSDVLAYWGVPDVDAPLALVPCESCGEIVCRCESATHDVNPDHDAA
jgi:hypothetical protein